MQAIPIIVVLLALLVVVVLASVIRRRAAAVRAAEMIEGLRLQAFALTPQDIGVAVESGEIFILVMDIGYPEAVASVVVSSAGDASIYFSTGGGVPGGIEHENVRLAVSAFLRQAAASRDSFAATSEYPYPVSGNVRFYLRTPEQTLFAEALERELREGAGALAPLYNAGQNVISELRKGNASLDHRR